MKLIVLKPEETEHVQAWISPEGEIFSLFLTSEEIENCLFKELTCLHLDSLKIIAEMICKRKKVICESPREYLLNHGWIHYCRVRGRWIWYGRTLNLQQLIVAKKIDNNETLQLLRDRLR